MAIRDYKTQQPLQSQVRTSTLKIKHSPSLRLGAMSQLREQRIQNTQDWMARSSITFPNWNFSRLEAIRTQLQRQGKRIPRTNLILACMKMLLPKCRTASKASHPGLVYEPSRTKRQNKRKKYTYKKVSTYCDMVTWDVFHCKSQHLKISFSQLVDLAVRVYLQYVYYKLLKTPAGKHSKARRPFSGKYHKRILKDKPFSLRIEYVLDQIPPPG